MKIGLDFYGVIANHLAEKAAYATRALGVEITEQEATRERMIARLGADGYATFAKSFSARPLASRLEASLYSGVRENLVALHADGVRFTVVSMRSTMALEAFVRAYVYDRHHLPIEEVIVVTSDEAKVDACRRSEVAVFFDDNRTVLERLVPLGITLVWANFYRIPDAGEQRFSIAHSWDEFAAIVRMLRMGH